MLKRYSLLLLLLAGLLGSCSTDFEINDKWKEINIIYGLLSINDSIQYIKVNKAYLNEYTNAVEVAKIEDSIYHQDSLLVKLEWFAGQTQDSIILKRVYLENKDTGVFANPGQYLYMPPAGFTVNPDANYKLTVRNLVTGNISSATTEVLNRISITTPQPYSTFSFQTGITNTPVDFRSGQGAKFYEINFYLYVTETDRLTGEIEKKTIRWPIVDKYILQNANGDVGVRITMPGARFFDFVQSKFNVDGHLDRSLDSMAFEALGGGEELFNYIEVNTPSIGVVQKNTTYTNVENGYGLFSSRSHLFYKVGVSSKTQDELKTNPKTEKLNFR